MFVVEPVPPPLSDIARERSQHVNSDPVAVASASPLITLNRAARAADGSGSLSASPPPRRAVGGRVRLVRLRQRSAGRAGRSANLPDGWAVGPN